MRRQMRRGCECCAPATVPAAGSLRLRRAENHAPEPPFNFGVRRMQGAASTSSAPWRGPLRSGMMERATRVAG